MLNLIRKDLIVLRWYFLFVAAYVLVFGVITVTPFSPMMLVVLPTMMLTLFATNLEIRNKSMLFVGSLPVGRKQIVQAKYASFFVYLAIGIVLGCLSNLSNQVRYGPEDFPFSLQTLALAVFVSMLFTSLYYPLYYWLGTKSAAIATFSTLFLTAAGIAGFISVADSVDIGIANVSGFPFLYALPLVGLALLFVSYRLSLAIFLRKDMGS
ncbi:ABC-2 transporter permease [Paenibacillus thermoaerophilus]|uniref:ABC-2 transporter permease n=1 Tax=Paenibacillus thermoaerophilus TaxID=1215385 RepID=A0ABW2UZG8_9BACL|nr:ABC-2 transporter permease [Paenibacillus thermoaerophilus]